MNFKREYYYKHDFYNMNSDDQLTILPKFKTRQGIVDCACGPNCILMVMNYFNDYSLEEDTICKLVECGCPNGTKIQKIVDLFRKHNYEIETSIEKTKDATTGKIFPVMEDFRKFVLENLKKGYPIIVESVYYGGHYQVIIGYDKRDDDIFNDIIIFADPDDETDDLQDGYHYFSAYQFYSMWFDDRFFLPHQREQPYIVVKGRSI